MTEALTNDTRQEANTALLEVDKGESLQISYSTTTQVYAPLVLGWAVIRVHIALHVALALQHCKLHTLLVQLVAVTVNGLHAVNAFIHC